MSVKNVMSTKKPERRQRMSGEQRRRQLIETAISLFAQKGFQGTTTKEIAKAAGITQAVIFQHFATKEELYSAIINYKLMQGEAEFLTALKNAARRKNDRTVFKSLAAHIFDFYARDPDYLRLVVYSGLEGHKLSTMFIRQEGLPLNNFLMDYIKQRIKDGAFRTVKPRVAARAFFGMVYNQAMVQVLYKESFLRVSAEEAAETFVSIFIHGISNK